MATNFRHSAEYIRRDIEAILDRVGILCRVFARGKENSSLKKKFEREPGKYSNGGKLVQDAIGVRVVLYFAEDVDIVSRLLEKEFVIDRESSTIDLPKTDQFAVTRHNLIYKVPNQHSDDVKRCIGTAPIDSTFEIQLRSILSEGWHEVEHDLRYKSKKNWETQEDLGRALNGIIATIETAEWSMRKIFDDLAYRNYKCQKWPEMLHNRIRMRAEPILSDEICKIFNEDNEIAKKIFRIDRRKVIFLFNSIRPTLPISLDNIVYIWNYLGPMEERITSITPSFVLETLLSLKGQILTGVVTEDEDEDVSFG